MKASLFIGKDMADKTFNYHQLGPEILEKIQSDIDAHKENPYAFKDSDAVRRNPEKDKNTFLRPAFSRDVDKIMNVPYFTRYSDKTQVFSLNKNDDISRRSYHVQLVSKIARNIGRMLNLNLNLIEAIALGHDIGHTPFGHAGERALNDICPLGFEHSEQSVRVVEMLEKDGQGLNLTWEVVDGIRNHQTEGEPSTPEGQIVRLSDKIAYVNSDIDDAIRAQILTEEDIPLQIRKTLGMTSAIRLDTLIHDVIMSSKDSPVIKMSQDIEGAMKELRDYLFAHVYKDSVAKTEEIKAKRMIKELYLYYDNHIDELPLRFKNMIVDGEDADRVICDYISGMTDQYCITKFNEYFMPRAWQVDGF